MWFCTVKTKELSQKLREDIISFHTRAEIWLRDLSHCVTQKDLYDDLMKAGTNITVPTIRRSFNNQRPYCWTPYHTLLLTKLHKKGWLENVGGNLNRTLEFWDTVLWSNNTKLKLFGYMDQWFYWHKKGKAYDKRNILFTWSGKEVG